MSPEEATDSGSSEGSANVMGQAASMDERSGHEATEMGSTPTADPPDVRLAAMTDTPNPRGVVSEHPDAPTPLLDLGLKHLSGAAISDCGLYRYCLWREWNTEPKLAFVMLNPSTADSHNDDPTIRRCIGFAKRDGYGGIVVRNLFAYRTPSPKALMDAHKTGLDVVGPENDDWLRDLNDNPEVGGVVAAWGAGTGIHRRLFNPRQMAVGAMFKGVLCGFLPHGEKPGPRHPLYLRGDTPIVPFSASLTAAFIKEGPDE